MVFVAAAADDDDNEPFYVLFGLGSYCTGARHMFIFFLHRIAWTVHYHVCSSVKHLTLL